MGRFSVPNPEPPRTRSERHRKRGTKRETVVGKKEGKKGMERGERERETITK